MEVSFAGQSHYKLHLDLCNLLSNHIFSNSEIFNSLWTIPAPKSSCVSSTIIWSRDIHCTFPQTDVPTYCGVSLFLSSNPTWPLTQQWFHSESTHFCYVTKLSWTSNCAQARTEAELHTEGHCWLPQPVFGWNRQVRKKYPSELHFKP